MAYSLVKVLPALVMLGMNVTYYSHLSKDGYVLFLLSMAVHLTFLQVAGGWLGAAQSYYFARGAEGGLSPDLIQWAGMQANIILWIFEFIALLIYTHNASIAFLTVFLTMAQTQMQTTYARLQLLGKIKHQLSLTVIYCAALTIFAVLLIVGRYASVVAFLSIHLAAVLLALIWNQGSLRLGQISRNSVSWHQFLQMTKYAIPMAFWFLFFATNSYLDRYLLGWLYLDLNTKDYFLTKELTQGVLSLFTAPFVMVAHVSIFNAFRLGDKNTAEDAMLKYASTTLMICLIAMPVLDNIFLLFIKKFINDNYLHSHTIFLFNYVGILSLCISMYTQKGLEVRGHTKLMSSLILLVLFFQLFAHYLFKEYSGIAKFSIINMAAGLFYLFLTIGFSSSILRFRIFRPLLFSGLLVTSLFYIVMQVIGGFYSVQYIDFFWCIWFIFFVLASTSYLYKLSKIWAV